MAILFGRAKEILSRYYGTGGACATHPSVDQFTYECLQYLLISGEYGNERKFCFCSQQGCITVPYELETPLKVKVDGKVGTVWDRWFEFHQTKFFEGCQPAGTALREDPNYYPTVYNMPPGGARFGLLAHCSEDCENKQVVVKGVDPSGREIVSFHKGKQIVGEVITLEPGQIKYTNYMFAQVTAVIKPQTKGYVTAFWVNPSTNLKGFLSDYSPLEEVPQYRRFVLTENCWRTCNAKVSVLGRIRLKENYADNDLIPFDNLLALNLAGQTVNGYYNHQPDLAVQSDRALTNVIDKENAHKKIKNGNPVEVYLPTSGGTIQNIIGSGRRFWGPNG